MRLYELLRRVRFDDLVQVLEDLTSRLPVISQNACFKMAFDELNLIEPSRTDDDIQVRRGPDGSLNGLSGHNLKDCDWKERLGCNLVLEEGPPVGETELAAYLLWNLTFHGFTSYRKHGYDPDEMNRFDNRIVALLQKQSANYARLSPRQFRHLKFQSDAYDDAKRLGERLKRHRNRSKRMRDHRQDETIKKLERSSNVHKTVAELVYRSKMRASDFAYLYKTSLIRDDCLHSCVADPQKRVDYVLDLCERYLGVDYTSFDSLAVVVNHDPLSPLSLEETSKLRNFFRKYGPWTRDTFVQYAMSGLGENIDVQIVAGCERK